VPDYEQPVSIPYAAEKIGLLVDIAPTLKHNLRMPVSVRPSRRYWLGLLALALVAFFCFAIPIYIIRPFRAQGSHELAFALLVRRLAPWISTLCAIVALLFTVVFWRSFPSRLARVTACLFALATCGFAALTRVNIYEKMFHPLGKPAFTSAAAAHVDPDDMVIAVTLAGESRAYPIRTMGYHHIVNDWLGRIPIVTTY